MLDAQGCVPTLDSRKPHEDGSSRLILRGPAVRKVTSLARKQFMREKRKSGHPSVLWRRLPKWRAAADEDGHYSFAVAL